MVEHPLSPDAHRGAASTIPGAGGVVIFSGVVRNETGGRPVKFLEYEAHAPMAEAKLREIGAGHPRAAGRGSSAWRCCTASDASRSASPRVLIAVSAAHRGDAFEACRYAIDTLKRTVPGVEEGALRGRRGLGGPAGRLRCASPPPSSAPFAATRCSPAAKPFWSPSPAAPTPSRSCTILTALAPAWRLTLHVLHVDHGLRADSARDAEFVRALGARLGVPVDVERVAVGPGSVEAAARAARYAALEAWADRLGADRIAIGHTADDQAETVLMRVLGGAGVRGLAGIPPRARPHHPPADRAPPPGAARRRWPRAGLDWVEDPTNRDPKFLRNRIRHELLPLLAASYHADVVPALARRRPGWRARRVDALDRTAPTRSSAWPASRPAR